MGRFGVTDTKEKALLKKMEDLSIYEKDIEEKFIRSGGPGGQSVNKSATCVQIRHIPTGITVKSQRERDQSVNRFLARRELAARIEEKIYGKKSEEQKKIEKIRKQKKRKRKKALDKLKSKGE